MIVQSRRILSCNWKIFASPHLASHWNRQLGVLGLGHLFPHLMCYMQHQTPLKTRAGAWQVLLTFLFWFAERHFGAAWLQRNSPIFKQKVIGTTWMLVGSFHSKITQTFFKVSSNKKPKKTTSSNMNVHFFRFAYYCERRRVLQTCHKWLRWCSFVLL